MKKLTLMFLALMTCFIGFQACSDTKTYAEMLEEEEDAIADFINKHGIVVIDQSDFHARDSVTAENEYVHLASGVYMNIKSKCKGWGDAKTDAERRALFNAADTIKNNDEVLVRFYEYSIIDQDTTYSNQSIAYFVDAFRYTKTSSSIAATFTDGYYSSYTSTAVPAGWLVPFEYIRNGAEVKLIVPSKMGSTSAMSAVYPYFYELKFQFWK